MGTAGSALLPSLVCAGILHISALLCRSGGRVATSVWVWVSGLCWSRELAKRPPACGSLCTSIAGLGPPVGRVHCLWLGRSSLILAPALLPLLPLPGLQLSHLSNGPETRQSLSCCPEPIMEFCMNSKEESGHKCIHCMLMGPFFW